MNDSGNKPRNKKSRKNLVMFVLSLALGGFGVTYSKQYIEEQVAFYKGQLEKTEPMVSVVVPNRNLLRGDIVTNHDLVLRDIPKQYADSNSVTESDYEVALGQRVDFDIDRGSPLLWAHLEGGLSPTFSGKVPEGLRAMTVRVDEINSISGFLQPKDRIDLLMTFGAGTTQQIFPLIQSLDVIATGTQTLVDKNVTGGKRNFNSITVQVTPKQAQKITLAQQMGKLTATLRNPDDEAPLVDSPMDLAQLLNLPQVAEKPKAKPKRVKRAPKKPAIEYIIGGR